MPWDQAAWDGDTLDFYRRLIALRNGEAALQRGGFRWVHTEPDAVVFLRETAQDRLLVRAARASTAPLSIPTSVLGAKTAQPVFAGELRTPEGGRITLPGDGPGFCVWRLV